MRFNIKDISYDSNEGNLLILGETSDAHPVFLLRKQLNDPGFELESEIKLELNQVGTLYEIKVNLHTILEQDNYPNGTVWTLYMVTETGDYKINIGEYNIENSVYYSDKSHIFKAKPYITKDRGLAFFVKSNFDVFAENIVYEEGILTSHILLENKRINDINMSFSFVLKQRISTSLVVHKETIEVASALLVNNVIEISSNIAELIFVNKDEPEFIWDLFLSINDGKHSPVLFPINVKNIEPKQNFLYHTLASNNFYKVKPYITGNNTLAIFLTNKHNEATAKEVIDENLKITIGINLNVKEFNESLLLIKKRNGSGDSFEYCEEQSFSVISYNNYLIATLLKKEFLKNFTLKGHEIFDFFVRLKNNNSHIVDLFIDVPKEVNRDFEYFGVEGLNNHKIKLFKNEESGLSLFLEDKNNYSDNSAIQTSKRGISVIGSCVSRDNFNRDFNADYKKYFEFIKMQNQTSIISLVSKKIPYNKSDINNISDWHASQLEQELNKSFFNNLQFGINDYIVLDFFSDVYFGVIKVNDSYITNNYWVLQKTGLYKNWASNPVYSLKTDFNTYFELWKESVQKLFEIISVCHPTPKVVLHKARFTDKYIKKDGTICLFENARKVSQYNSLWSILDEYVEMNFDVIPISVSNEKIISTENHKWGKFNVHYDLPYYHEFLKKLRNKLELN